MPHENEELGRSPSMQDHVSKASLMSLSGVGNSRLSMPALLAVIYMVIRPVHEES